MCNKMFYWSLAIFFYVLVSSVVIYISMLVWNFLVPEVFNGPRLAFWQAAALLWLVDLVGKRFRK